MNNNIENITSFLQDKTARYALLGIAGILLMFFLFTMIFGKVDYSYDLYTVGRGDLKVNLVEAADIKAVNFTEITTPGSRGGRYWNQQLPAITYLILEGAYVEKGDTLVKLDVSDILTQKETTTEELKLKELEYQQLLEQNRSADVTAERRMQTVQYALENNRLNLTLAQFEAETVKRERELQLDITRIDSMKVSTENASSAALREFTRIRKYDEMQQIRDDLKEMEEKIVSYDILAPFPGLVIYHKTGWPQPIAVKEGDTPYPGQSLIQLPDLSKIKAVMRINDIDRENIWIGQAGRLRLEAFPDKYYEGEVVSIGQLSQKAFSLDYSNVKILEVEFMLGNSDQALRPGMSATVELLSEEVKDVLTVPLSGVFERDGVTFVALSNGSDLELQQITLGVRNSSFVAVTEGLEEGDNIIADYPMYVGFPVGQYDEWEWQESEIALLESHFDQIEELGIQYDYNTNRNKAVNVEPATEDEIDDEQIKAILERMGREATPENIERMKERMKSGGFQRGGMGGGREGGMPGGREGMGRPQGDPGGSGHPGSEGMKSPQTQQKKAEPVKKEKKKVGGF